MDINEQAKAKADEIINTTNRPSRVAQLLFDATRRSAELAVEVDRLAAERDAAAFEALEMRNELREADRRADNLQSDYEALEGLLRDVLYEALEDRVSWPAEGTSMDHVQHMAEALQRFGFPPRVSGIVDFRRSVESQR